MKTLVRALLRKAGFEIKRVYPDKVDADEEKYLKYLRGGNIPWSDGFVQAEERFLREILTNSRFLEQFKEGRLPARFGVGFEERCVEYPWLLTRLRLGTGPILDAGSTLNFSYILDLPVFRHRKLHILTLAPESRCFWHKGVSYLYADLRDIPIRDEYYEVVVCVSTLEHVGCDNRIFTNNDSHNENHPEDFVSALRELRRVLVPGGSLFLTVPFGVYQYLGMQQQFDRKTLDRALEAFGKATEINETFYRYDAGGWKLADVRECLGCEYVGWVADAWTRRQWPDHIPVERDRAAAARAVACVRLIKG